MFWISFSKPIPSKTKAYSINDYREKMIQKEISRMGD